MNPVLLSGHEQQLLDSILNEDTLTNRQGRNQDLVVSLLKRALDIQMPRKTVAFVKNSIYFDALQYRQSLDCAGHRGLDIPLSKIHHLIILVIPNIYAHFSNKY
ncbi:unnamed protein product [Adineta steineri]|uniref:Uncharacterized protein n=1 Tax=Adineta steineri TaxID=433720 RepID=A0A819TLH3_9BILA|nr:unnamed protein product [Adineta steineri]CAF4080281.1 unnamed protein product [Adineta steineri]